MSGQAERLSAGALIERHEVILSDAYGVLVNASGALPGALEFVHACERAGRPLFVVTNDASRDSQECARHYQSYGLPIHADQVVCSADVMVEDLRELRAASQRLRCVVIGTPATHERVLASGAEIVAPVGHASLPASVAVSYPGDIDAIVIGARHPESLPQCHGALNAALGAVHAGRPLRLLLPNPDVIYPIGTDESGEEQFAFTAGALAGMLELGLRARLGAAAPAFEPIGKPQTRLFREALRRAGVAASSRVVMLGDQLATDILGAQRVGIASALLLSGVARWEPSGSNVGDASVSPTYVVDSLRT